MSSAERVEQGIPLTPELDRALQHGTSIGGARPKALIESHHQKYIAKFSSSSDAYDVVKSEFSAMKLAALSGLRVAPVKLVQASGKDVVLVERFDRVWNGKAFARKNLISALSLLELDEMMGHHGSYKDLADLIRHRFKTPKSDLRELYRRLLFNILVGNNDDHARNHAALWNGRDLELSPAYDLCPQRRTGRECNQALYVFESDKRSLLEVAFSASSDFLTSRAEAIVETEQIMTSIIDHFKDVTEEAKLTMVGMAYMRRGQMFKDYAFQDLGVDAKALLKLRTKFK